MKRTFDVYGKTRALRMARHVGLAIAFVPATNSKAYFLVNT